VQADRFCCPDGVVVDYIEIQRASGVEANISRRRRRRRGEVKI